MRIQHVSVKNFRSLRDVEIDFDDITTFIGPNGTGKSTVLRALDWFFNGGKGGELSDADCSYGATGEQIEVRVTFTGLSSADRDALGKYVVDDVDQFTAWKIRSTSGAEVLSANAKGFPAFTPVKDASNAPAKKEAYGRVLAEWPELGLPSAGTGPKIDAAIAAWEAENLHRLEDVPEVQTNFFGFNSNSKMSGLFDFVLVTADLRASEEAQDSKATIIGRILERSVDRTAADEEVAKIVERSRLEQQKVYAKAFGEQLETITRELNLVVEGYTPGRTVAVAPADVDIKSPRTTFEVKIKDGQTETSVANQGHGFQRTLLISALQLLAQSGAAGDEGVICLAIEEPELFQHPIQAQAFAKVLRSLAEDPVKRIQVTYATHSPYFIEAQKFHQVRRMTRSVEPEPRVSVHGATLDQVKSRLVDVMNASVVESQLDGTISNQLSTALFAERAFLVEGTTEAAVFYGLGDRESVGRLETQGLSIVSVSGKLNILLAHAILDAVGIPTYAMFDADSGFEGRARRYGKDQAKIALERKGHVSANKKLLRYFGLTEVDFPAECVGEQVAILDDHLEELLGQQWPEWQTELDALEKQTGVMARKNNQAYRTATLRSAGEVPAVLLDALAMALGK